MKLKEILKRKQCHIFDMDGTLVNLEKLNHSSYASTIEKYFKIDFSNGNYQKFFSGSKTADGFNSFLKSKNISDYDVDELIKDFRKKKNFNLQNNFENCVFLIEGAREYLTHLKNSKKTIILATSTIKKFTNIIIEKLEIKNFFDLIITAEDITKGKPDPEIFDLAVEKSNAQKSETVVYEDSRNGIASAKNAGILSVGIHTKGLNDLTVKDADYIIRSFKELI